VQTIYINAARFLTNFVPDNSIECFHIYFPDPWPKKRLFNSANLEQLLYCLIPTGAIRITTDHAEYFDQIQEVLTAQGNRLEKIKFFPTASANQGEWVDTNFERKYLKERKLIYTIAVRKR